MEQTMAAAKDQSVIQSIYSSVKMLVQKYSPEAAASTSSKADPLNHNAYFWYGHDTVPRSNVGQHRGTVNEDNPSYDIEAAAARDRSRRRTACLAAHLAPGDKDQIALTLHDTVAAPEMREHSERVFGEAFSEEAMVGRVLVRGIRAITGKIATAKKKGMLPLSLRSFMSNMLMCATRGGGTVSQNAIGRQLVPDFSEGARKRIIRKAGLKRKKFDEDDLGQFSLVDHEAKRWKYKDDEINKLREYMLDNPYTRDSPQQNDTVYKRDYIG